MTKAFQGVITALITPFYEGSVDYESLERLIDFQVKLGIDGVVVNGTTAESPTLSEAERKQIFKFVQKTIPKNCRLIMGTGSNSTEKTVQDSQEAEKLGAEACLVVVPYYNKPPQRGLLEHFKNVANHIEIPVILYNVPGRTITALELETIQKLSEHPQIIGIKEASGNIEFAQQIRKACGQEFVLLSGDDGTYDQFMKAGGDGVISVASHILPQAMKQQNISENRQLIDALFSEANPIPLKMAMYLMGLIRSPELRLPLVTLGAEKTEQLRAILKTKELIR